MCTFWIPKQKKHKYILELVISTQYRYNIPCALSARPILPEDIQFFSLFFSLRNTQLHDIVKWHTLTLPIHNFWQIIYDGHVDRPERIMHKCFHTIECIYVKYFNDPHNTYIPRNVNYWLCARQTQSKSEENCKCIFFSKFHNFNHRIGAFEIPGQSGHSKTMHRKWA